MVIKKHIYITLKSLDRKYQGTLFSSNVNEPVYYCKLATLEYCGWIELTFDDIINRALKNQLRSRDFKKILEKEIIGRTNGFQYDRHFRPMLISAVGLKRAESIELELKRSNDFNTLESELSSMKEFRNRAAHTWIQNTTRTFPAPSDLLRRFDLIYPILRQIYSKVT